MSLLSLALVLPLASAPCEGERVVLLPFQAVALSKAEVRQVEDSVRQVAQTLPGLCVEPRADTVAKLRARGRQLPACTDPACRGAQVLALGAEQLVRGVALGVGGGRAVTLTRVDREGLEAHATVQLSGEGLPPGGDEARLREALGALWAQPPSPGELKRSATAWPTVLLAAGGVAVAAGVGFGLALRNTEAALSMGTGGCTGQGEAFRSCFAGRLQQGRQQALSANVLLGTGALLGASGAILFIWELP